MSLWFADLLLSRLQLNSAARGQHESLAGKTAGKNGDEDGAAQHLGRVLTREERPHLRRTWPSGRGGTRSPKDRAGLQEEARRDDATPGGRYDSSLQGPGQIGSGPCARTGGALGAKVGSRVDRDTKVKGEKELKKKEESPPRRPTVPTPTNESPPDEEGQGCGQWPRRHCDPLQHECGPPTENKAGAALRRIYPEEGTSKIVAVSASATITQN
ncbi:hypothetical protein NDU88_000728 [Pleurodeles waltl]|uniref:Uncharacterized protein n=1 Tax=Pleurodeles waltl TaxID=8319 RepID=A0AAV7URY3_PLEWA|nr:hypothetical protein NDU88_000728 [Pleurodeles waltl]